MASLEGQTIASTYKQLLKITSEGVGADASGKYVEDGLGTDTALSLSTTRVGIGTTSVSSDATFGVSGNIELKNAGDKYWIPRQSDGALTGSIYSRTGSNVTISGAGSSSGQIEFIPSSANSSAVAMTIDSSQNSTFEGNVLFNGVVQLADVAQSIDFIQSGAINIDSNNDQTGRVLTIGTNRTGDSGGTTIATFTDTGNVGIGTTSPRSVLHTSDGTASGITARDDAIIITHSANPKLAFEDASEGSGDKVMLFNYFDETLHISSMTDDMTGWDNIYIASFNRDGNVGIGENNPATVLHIKGPNDDTYGQLRIQGTGTNADAQILFDTDSNGRGIYLDESDTNKLKIYTGSGKGTKEVVIDNDGKVGIGETSMDAMLVIKGDTDASTTPSIRLKDGSDTREAWISNTSGDLVLANGGDDNVSHCMLKMFDGNIMQFATSGLERMRINSVGYLNLASGCEVGSHATEGVTVNGSSGAYTTVLTFSEGGGGRGKYLVTGVQQGVGVGTAFEIIIGVSTSSAIYLYESIDLNSMSINISGNSLQARHEASTSTIVINVNAIPLCLHGN
jgi:hypothetical protein